MKYYCNPLNIEYKYQFVRNTAGGEKEAHVYREAADPSLVLFKGLYYMFPSMTAGFLTSEDLGAWDFHPFADDVVPIYDYAPDVCVVGDYLYLSASRREEACDFYRTKDPLAEPFVRIPGSFAFWDPCLFLDDDGRLYFYYGCSNQTPIYGVEMDMETMKPRTQPMPLIYSNRDLLGFERIGNDHVPPKSKEEADLQSDAMIEQFMAAPEEMRLAQGLQSREDVEKFVGALSSDAPYIEGAWMTKHDGKYYLQYATPGTEYNIYADAVYVSDEPLGKFALARNNPYSYKPGGFMNGAGHGSTCKDKLGKYWHMASMSISKNDPMERRLGLWKAGFDSDGELWCDQRYGDWPISLDAPAFAAPDYMLLSHDSTVTATENGLVVDLGDSYDVRAIQINFEDGVILRDDFVPGFVTSYNERYIETKPGYTRWILSGSEDGKGYSLIADKSDADTDLPHDFISIDQGIRVRYLKLSDISVPYGSPMVSALRVFGPPSGEAPRVVDDVVLERTGELDMTVRWKDTSASGYNILWGYHPDKLYHSYMVFDKTEQHIGALVKGLDVYVRVDAFSKGGIAEGAVVRLK